MSRKRYTEIILPSVFPGQKRTLWAILSLGILTLLPLFFGCAPKVVIPVEPVREIQPERDSEAALFQKAEALAEARSYAASLVAFESFLKRFPNSQKADAALKRIGDIHAAQGDIAAARRAYERLVEMYPESHLVVEGKMEILEADYQSADYQGVIEGADALLRLSLSDPVRVRTLTLMGDSLMALRRFPEALTAYLRLVQIPGDPDRQSSMSRFEQAIELTESAALRALIQDTEVPHLKMRLTLAAARNAADSSKPEEAIKILKDFLDRYPADDPKGEIQTLLKELTAEASFDRHAIGCLIPLTGAYQAYGQKALRGVEMALADFSAVSGNPEIRLIIQDTQSSSESAVAALKKLHQAGTAAVIGPIAKAEAVAAEAQNLKIPLIALTQKDGIAAVGDYIFRNFITPRMQVEALVDYCVKKLGIRRFAVLYPEESYGKTFMSLFWDAVIAHGGTLMGIESYDVDQTDFADPIKKLVGLHYNIPEEIARRTSAGSHKTGSGTDWGISGDEGVAHASEEVSGRLKGGAHIDFEALFIPDAPDKAGLILPQLAFYDIREVYLLGTNLWHSKRLIEMAQKYAQGAMMPDGFDSNSDSAPVQGFVNRFTSLYGEQPGFMEAVAYDTARILFDAGKTPDIRSRSALREILSKLDGFQGLTGPTGFGPEGDVRKTPFLFRIKGDKFVEVR